MSIFEFSKASIEWVHYMSKLARGAMAFRSEYNAYTGNQDKIQPGSPAEAHKELTTTFARFTSYTHYNWTMGIPLAAFKIASAATWFNAIPAIADIAFTSTWKAYSRVYDSYRNNLEQELSLVNTYVTLKAENGGVVEDEKKETVAAYIKPKQSITSNILDKMVYGGLNFISNLSRISNNFIHRIPGVNYIASNVTGLYEWGAGKATSSLNLVFDFFKINQENRELATISTKAVLTKYLPGMAFGLMAGAMVAATYGAAISSIAASSFMIGLMMPYFAMGDYNHLKFLKDNINRVKADNNIVYTNVGELRQKTMALVPEHLKKQHEQQKPSVVETAKSAARSFVNDLYNGLVPSNQRVLAQDSFVALYEQSKQVAAESKKSR